MESLAASIPQELLQPTPLTLTPLQQNLEDFDPEFEEIKKALRRKAYFGVSVTQPFDSLTTIAWLMDYMPGLELKLELDQLDRIADGMATKEDEECFVDDGVDGVLPALDWWRHASESLLDHPERKFIPEPTFAHHREAILKLLNDALAAIVPAWQEGCEFSDDCSREGGATRELLKRYRRFTRYVCAFAQERFPDANLKELLERS